MSKVIELFLFDILVAILKIEETVKNFDDGNELKHNHMAWDSVIREFKIIGEATKHLIEGNLFETNKRSIVNFRNLLIHEYFGINEEEVFDISINKLADLKETVITKIQLIQKDLKEELIVDFIDEHKHLEFIIKNLENLKC